MKTPLKESILSTLAYFDIAGFPLTKEELFRFLWKPPSVSFDVFFGELESMVGTEVGSQFGFYFLPGRESIVEARRSGVIVNDTKIQTAIRAVKLIRMVPFLRAVCLSSSVASETSDEKSDIDFFIITERKRIWIVRLCTNLILRLFGMRVYGKNRKNKICLCFYVDSDHLNLAPWRIHDEDIHLAYWLNHMIPLYDPLGYYGRFMQANAWTLKFLPHIVAGMNVPLSQVPDGKFSLLWKNMWERMWYGGYGDIIEKQTQAIQWQKMKLSLKEKSKLKNNETVIEDGVLKLHENDRRVWYRTEWLAKKSTYTV